MTKKSQMVNRGIIKRSSLLLKKLKKETQKKPKAILRNLFSFLQKLHTFSLEIKQSNYKHVYIFPIVKSFCLFTNPIFGLKSCHGVDLAVEICTKKVEVTGKVHA